MVDATGEGGVKAPTYIYLVELLYLAVAVGLAVLYGNWHSLRTAIHDPIGAIPLSVPWWGAIGGITISLTGIFRNANKWDAAYTKWHLARPVLGAVVGTVGYLIYVVAIRATGTMIQPKDLNARATADLIGFLVGYREDVFRNLLKRATSFLFADRSSQTSKTNHVGGSTDME